MNLAIRVQINLCSGYGLLPDDTKPLPEPMFTYYPWGPLAFSWGKCARNCFNIILYKVFEKYIFENLPGTNLLKNDRDGCMKSYDIKLPNNNVLLDYNQSILWPSMYCPIASMVSYPLVESIGTNHATKHLGQLFKYYLGIWWHLYSKLFQRIDNSTKT